MSENNLSHDFLQRTVSFQKRIGYQFNDPELLYLAFVQRSNESSQAPSQNNERLEFLGDAAISLIVGSALYGEYPEADEGFMTIERSKLVCGQNLSAWGYEAGFDRMISAGEGVLITAAMVEDCVEAVAGALFLDGGLDAVKGFLQSFADYPDQGTGFDARRHLERDCEFEKLGSPKFKTVRRFANGGRIFETTVTLGGKEAGTGIGSDQITSERNAARDALGRLNRVSAAEQQKRAAVQRAHFRRILSGRIRASRRPEVVSLSEAEKQAAAKSAPVAVPPAAQKTNSAGTPAVASANAKVRLQELCTRLKLGAPRYVDMPASQKTGQARASLALMLNRENVVTVTAESKTRAEEDAARRVLEVLTAEEQGRAAWLRSDLDDLGKRLEKVFCTELQKNRGREVRFELPPRAEGDVLYSCRMVVGAGTILTEAAAASEELARLYALVRAATQTRMWPAVLKRLNIPARTKKPEIPPRPDLLVADQMKSAGLSLMKIALPCGGTNNAPVFAVGMFAGEELAVCMTGPNKKLAEILASLLILDRLANNRPVVPQPPRAEPPAAKSAPAPAATAKPAAKKPRRGLKQRFIDWFHRLGDAYTK
ncbi:MAG: hypothetical protein J6Z30_04130 [Pyramidobacter sp.]|nr:hypothetical protein [Pyramidobacter sp.]